MSFMTCQPSEWNYHCKPKNSQPFEKEKALLTFYPNKQTAKKRMHVTHCKDKMPKI
jgi:hypothetical protein